MRITEIREIAVPLRSDIANAVVNFSAHRVSLVAVFSDVIRDGAPLVGVAFNSIGRHSQSGILGERMIPRVLAAMPDDLTDPHTGLIDPAAVLRRALSDEKPGGHGDRACAAAALELACWDLLAKYADEPAHATIARAFGTTPATDGVPVYAAGGYYRGVHDLSALDDEIRGYLDAGYRAVKIKIGGQSIGDDLRRVETAIEATGAADRVAVDANARFDEVGALAYARALAPYGLRWYEEPVDPLDYAATAAVIAEYPGAVATGENLFSRQDTINLLRYSGIRPDRDVLQMDAGLSYGLTEYHAIVTAIQDAGFPRTSVMPHGGHLINLHIVVGLGLGGCEAYPGVFAPFGGYGPSSTVTDGVIIPADDPGFGLEAKPGLSELIIELTEKAS